MSHKFLDINWVDLSSKLSDRDTQQNLKVCRVCHFSYQLSLIRIFPQNSPPGSGLSPGVYPNPILKTPLQQTPLQGGTGVG
ncbi:MAG: hypothetical protein SWX82_04645 [Cyanobacteriota bacterium]|nr:hypothetical protein [Cyanobacteriota bacterium]